MPHRGPAVETTAAELSAGQIAAVAAWQQEAARASRALHQGQALPQQKRTVVHTLPARRVTIYQGHYTRISKC
eukprot:6267572-Amphidinium_carterae.1